MLIAWEKGLVLEKEGKIRQALGSNKYSQKMV
jgi:hypothetical protein